MSGRSLQKVVSPLTRRAVLALKLALGLFIFFLAAGHILKPISDPDFFWHLKTGAWIWEHKALPGEFLFSFTAPATLDATLRFTMTSYWASQVVTYLFFAAGEWKGIVALRFVLMALFGWALARRRRGDDLIFLGLLALTSIVMRTYLFERPQVISFICFALLLEQLDWLRHRPADSDSLPLLRVIALPLLMAVWANCHGGYVIGQMVIVLYLAVEAAKYLHPSLGPLPWKRYRLFLAVGAAGLLSSFVNPNGYHGLQIALLPSWMTVINLEYQSTINVYLRSGGPEILVYWFLLGLAIFGTLLSSSRPDPTRIALLAFTGFISFTQVRHLAFLVVVSLPIAQEFLSRERLRTAGRILVIGPAVLVGLMFLQYDWGYLKGRPAVLGASLPLFPADAADFLETAGLQGNMYNYYGWGGYLLWRLAPAKVFIDGRNSSQDLFNKAQMFDDGSARVSIGGRPYWKTVFTSYGIRYTVTPFFDHFTGVFLALLDNLVADPGWIPVYIGLNSIVFVEKTAENRAIIERQAIPRQQVFPILLERCDTLIQALPNNAPYHIAKGDLLERLSRFAEAKASYERAGAIVPSNLLVRDRLDWLREQGVN